MGRRNLFRGSIASGALQEVIQRPVRLHTGGGPEEGVLFVCPCGGETWMICAIAERQHMICVSCGASYSGSK